MANQDWTVNYETLEVDSQGHYQSALFFIICIGPSQKANTQDLLDHCAKAAISCTYCIFLARNSPSWSPLNTHARHLQAFTSLFGTLAGSLLSFRSYCGKPTAFADPLPAFSSLWSSFLHCRISTSSQARSQLARPLRDANCVCRSSTNIHKLLRDANLT